MGLVWVRSSVCLAPGLDSPDPAPAGGLPFGNPEGVPTCRGPGGPRGCAGGRSCTRRVRPRGLDDGETEALQDVEDLTHGLRDRVQPAEAARPAGQRDVDWLGAGERGRPQLRLPRFEG